MIGYAYTFIFFKGNIFPKYALAWYFLGKMREEKLTYGFLWFGICVAGIQFDYVHQQGQGCVGVLLNGHTKSTKHDKSYLSIVP